MTDSNTVDVNTDDLDAFSELMFSPTTPADAEAPKADDEAKEVDEVSETPSATEEESADEAVEAESDGEDAPADDDEDESDEPEEAPKAKRKSARERINELTRQAREAERRAEDLERRLDELASGAKKDTPAPKEAAAPTAEGAPDPDARLESGELVYPLGEFDPKFIRDLTRFTIKIESEAANKAAEEARQRREAEQAEKALVEAWEGKMEEAAARLPDLKEKAATLDSTFRDLDPQYGTFLAETIMSMDKGPEVLHYLGDNLSEARTIVASGAMKAVLALGRIEARLTSGDKVEKGKVVPTRAPEPAPLNRGSSGKNLVAADTDDLDAFEKQFFK